MENTQIKNNLNNWKMINFISIMLVLVSFILLAVKVWLDFKTITSPLLPKYVVIFKNGVSINVVCFLLAGLLPAIFLRVRKKYIISTFCILLFLIAGFLLKDSVKIYEHFYGLSRYLD